MSYSPTTHMWSFHLAIAPLYLIGLVAPEWLIYTSTVQLSAFIMWLFHTWMHIQFTRKAAAELQERLHAELNKLEDMLKRIKEKQDESH